MSLGFMPVANGQAIQEITDTIQATQETDEISVVTETPDVGNIDTLSVGEDFFIELPEPFEWETATLKGKLKMQGLPLSPNVKIFLKKDSLVSISLTAPLLGEVGRLDLTPDSVLVVNKMSKTYWALSEDQLPEKVATKIVNTGDDSNTENLTSGKGSLGVIGGIKNVQDLLLANFFLPGIDLQEVELDEVIDIYADGDQLNVVPKGEAEIEGVKYGFVIDQYFKPLMLIVIPEVREGLEVDAFYTYGLQGYDLRFVYQDKNKGLEATLELKNPEYKGDAPKPVVLGRNYRRVERFEEIFR